MKAERTVLLTVVSTHQFVIPDTNTDEEAVSIAESYLEDGEEGEVLDRMVDATDVFRSDDSEEL